MILWYIKYMNNKKRCPILRCLLLLFADVFALVITISIINEIFNTEIQANWLTISLIPLFVIFAELSKLYHGNIFYPGITFSSAEEIKRISYVLIGVFSFDYAMLQNEIGISFKLIFSHVLILVFGILSIILCRWFVRVFMKKYNVGISNTIILGAGKTGQMVAKLLAKNNHLGINPVGFIDDNKSLHNQQFHNIPILGALTKLNKLMEEYQVSYIVICLPYNKIKQIIEEHFNNNNISHILIVPDNEVFSSMWSYVYDLDGLLAIELRRNLHLKGYIFCKNVFHYLLTVIVVVITMPLWIVIACIVNLS